jgi:N utilization substance protein A
MPQVQEALAKKAENRPLTPEEYTLLGQFVDRVERRNTQIKEEAVRADEERVSTARAEVPAAAFTMSLDQLGLKEHVFNILVEAGYENIGNLMMSLKLDENKVLGLAGVGPKAIQNIHDQLAAMQFPEIPMEVKAEAPVAEEAPAEEMVEPIPVDGLLEVEKTTKVKEAEEETEEENAKDGVSLDELFKLKPEIFQSPSGTDEDEAAKKKGKKQKKKGVELVLDEELGEVVGHKKHKRGEDDLGVDE